MIATFKPYLLRYRWLLLITYVTGVMQTIASSLTPLAGKVFFDYVLPRQAPGFLVLSSEFPALKWLFSAIGHVTTNVKGFAVFAFIFTVALGILQVSRQLAGFFLQNRMTAQINTDLFDKIIHASLQKQQSYARGYLNARIMADSGAFEMLARTLLPSLANNVMRFTFGLAILSSINLKMTLICLATAPVYLLTNWLFAAKVRRLAHQTAEQSAANFAYVQNSLQGIETIKAFNLEPERINCFARRLDNLIVTRLQYFNTGLVSSAIARLAQLCCLLALLIFAEEFYRNGELTAGDIIAFISYMGFLAGPLSSLAMLYISLQPTLVAIRRVKEVLDFPDENDEVGNVASQPASARPPGQEEKIAPVKEIILKKLGYYQDSECAVFEDLDLELVRGRTDLVNWRSGAGKTTLARLLLKFLRPTAGMILVDGIPLHEIKTDAWRAVVGYKPQTDFFFAGSIRENLLVACSGADDQELLRVLRLCCAEEFVLNRPDGLDNLLNDGAMNLSEGQRQRLALARVVLKNPALVVLDEPFAAIDEQSSSLIMQNLQQFFSERICIIMSHQALENTHK